MSVRCCSESTEYSDWEPDGINLQPPKRRSQRQIKRRRWSSLDASESSDDADNDTDRRGKVKVKPDSDDDDDGEVRKRPSRKKVSSSRSRKKATAAGKQKKQVFVQFPIIFYAPQLYRQVLLRRVLAMGILSVCLSVRPSLCHDPVVYQAQVR